MLKRRPGLRPPAKPAAATPPAAERTAAPGIFTAPAAPRAGDKQDKRESATRRAHRLRKKEIFARANSAS